MDLLQKSKSILCDSLTYLPIHLGTSLEQEWTNPGSQVAQASKFCAVAPDVSSYSAHNLLHVTKLASEILRLLLHFWCICIPLS